MTNKNNNKTQFYKKKWFWILIVIVAVALVVGDELTPSDKTKGDKATTSTAVTTTTTADKTNKNTTTEKIIDLAYIYQDSVAGDKTGNWHLIKLNEKCSNIQNYAVDFYNKYSKSESDVIAIVDTKAGLTTNVHKLTDDTLDVSIYNYVDGEEGSADLLFTGKLQKELSVNISSGKIEKIQ